MPPRYVSDILPALSIEAILEVAHTIEAERPALDVLRNDWLGRVRSATTPFELRLGLVARERGVIAVDRPERKVIAPADAWDAPVGGVVSALVGFAWWPDISAWEVMHTVRFGAALAAFYEHYLADIGRLDDRGLDIDRHEPRRADRLRMRRLEQDARDPDTRRERITNEASVGLVDRGLQVLGYELYAFRSGMFGGALIEPTGPYLALGVAADYARLHHARLHTPAFRRWLEACCVPGRDYATDAATFEARVADVLGGLLSTEVGAAARVARARRVLADVGHRLCHLERWRPEALTIIADAIHACDGASDCDEVVAAALEEVAVAAGDVGLLALGYRPTLQPDKEPEVTRTVRGAVLVQRAWQVQAALGSALQECPALVDAVLAGPRHDDLIEELATTSLAITEQLPALADGYFGWLQIAFSELRDEDPELAERRWHYRIAQRTLPENDHGAYEVMVNPYLKRVPLTFDAPWNDALIRGELVDKPFRPRQTRSTWYCFLGPGRAGMVYLPLVPRLSALLHSLRTPRRLDELIADRDFGAEFIARAIADEAVLVIHKPFIAQPPRPLDFYDQIGVGSDLGETPGPWDEPDQADAYAAFCERSEHYLASSRALCRVADIAPDARVAELGFGTGQTTRAILELLGPEGSVLAVDPAPLMVARIGRHVPDARARFELGGASTLAWTAIYEGGFERIVANACIWLAPDVTTALMNLARAATVSGRIALSLPAEFLGRYTQPAPGSDLNALIAAERAALGLATPVSGGLDRALGSIDAFTKALREAGWTDVRYELFEQPWTLGELFAWMSLPVVAQGLCVEAEREHVPELLRRVAERVDPEVSLVATWYLVTANKEAEAA